MNIPHSPDNNVFVCPRPRTPSICFMSLPTHHTPRQTRDTLAANQRRLNMIILRFCVFPKEIIRRGPHPGSIFLARCVLCGYPSHLKPPNQLICRDRVYEKQRVGRFRKIVAFIAEGLPARQANVTPPNLREKAWKKVTRAFLRNVLVNSCIMGQYAE